ncbi:hypothetical protein V8E52_004869 [Russula decolorans]
MGESSGSDNKSNLVRQARHKGKRDGSFVEYIHSSGFTECSWGAVTTRRGPGSFGETRQIFRVNLSLSLYNPPLYLYMMKKDKEKIFAIHQVLVGVPGGPPARYLKGRSPTNRAPYSGRNRWITQTLDETYESMLMKINMMMLRKPAVRLLRCLVAAVRPLRVEEIAEILSHQENWKKT